MRVRIHTHTHTKLLVIHCSYNVMTFSLISIVQYSSRQRPGATIMENPIYFDVNVGFSGQGDDTGATFVVDDDDKAPLTANMMVNTDVDDRKPVRSNGNSLSVKYSTNGHQYEEISNI